MPTLTARHEAVVSSIEDPENRGRFKVKCVGLLGDADTELPVFVELVPDWGWFVVPEVGEIVEIEIVVSGDRDEVWGQATLEAMSPVWRGKRFVTNVELDKPFPPIPGIPDDKSIPTPPHSELVSENYGRRRGFASPHGHLLMFDDEDPRVSLLWVKDRLDPGEAPDSGKSTRLDIEPDGSFVVNVLDKHKLTLGADGSFEADVLGEHKMILGADGKLTVELGGGASLVLDKNAADATMQLGNGDSHVAVAEPLKLLWAALKTKLDAFDSHIHPTGMGPSGPPAPPIVAPDFDDDIISDKLSLPKT